MRDYSKLEGFWDFWSPVLIAVGCALIGVFLRLWLSWHSIGTNDVINWYVSSRVISEYGLFEAYRVDVYLNNPPLISLLVAWLFELSKLSEVPFSFLLRIPGILGEGLSIFLLSCVGCRLGGGGVRRGVLLGVLLALNPLSILVTGYHGHTDGLVGGLVSLAFYLAGVYGAYGLAGFCLGLAMNVKLIPLVLWPALFFSIPHDASCLRSRLLFGVGFLGALVPFVVAYGCYGDVFAERVFGYRSILDYWGIQTFLLIFRSQFGGWRTVFDWLIVWYQKLGPYVILCITMIVNYKFMEGRTCWQRGAVSFAIMAVLAQGFGITYTALALPLILLTEVVWGVKFSVTNALALWVTYGYFLVRKWPWQSIHIGTSPKLAVLLMFIMWTMLLHFTISSLLQPNNSEVRKN